MQKLERRFGSTRLGTTAVARSAHGKMQRLGENSSLMIPFAFSPDGHLVYSGGGVWSAPFDTSDPDLRLGFAQDGIEQPDGVTDIAEFPATWSVLRTAQPRVIHHDSSDDAAAEARALADMGGKTLLMLPLTDLVACTVALYGVVNRTLTSCT